MFRDFFCPLVVAHGVVNAGVVGALVSLGLDLIGLFDVVQKCGGLLRREEFDFISGALPHRTYLVHGVLLDDLPFYSGAQDGGKHILGLLDGGFGVAARLPVLSGSVLGHGGEGAVEGGGAQLGQLQVSNDRENLFVKLRFVLFHGSRLQLLGCVFPEPAVCEFFEGGFSAVHGDAVFDIRLKLPCEFLHSLLPLFWGKPGVRGEGGGLDQLLSVDVPPEAHGDLIGSAALFNRCHGYSSLAFSIMVSIAFSISCDT